MSFYVSIVSKFRVWLDGKGMEYGRGTGNYGKVDGGVFVFHVIVMKGIFMKKSYCLDI
jgi:hypothetical protein